MSRRGHRVAPRRLGVAVEALVGDVVPEGDLAAVQRAWLAVAGERIAAHATPVALRGGVLTVACDEAVWAQQLALRGPELVARLAATVPAAGVDEVRVRAGR